MPALTIVVCAFDMARELPRTIFTLGRTYQRGVDDVDYDIVVVDNGSARPVNEAALRAIFPALSVIRVDTPEPSPAAAINRAMAGARGDLLALWIDGARLASPGIVAAAVAAHRGDRAAVIGTLAFHLGPDVQMRSHAAGYDRAAEDALLASVPWRRDGYRLFDIAVLAGSSRGGWFAPIAESNAIFLARDAWARLGGLDERFRAPGGGYVNLDFWERAVALAPPLMLLGEGTFHQVHGGAATNGSADDRAVMAAEYRRLHGRPHAMPEYVPRCIAADAAPRLAPGLPQAPDTRRVRSIAGRGFAVGVAPDLLASVQRATLRTRYKGRRLAKNPFDLALYLRLLEKLRPATIIEIGTSEGESALWLRDQCRAIDLPDTRVLTIDLTPPALDEDGIRVFAGDSTAPADTFPTREIEAAPRPWLVIEDSAHSHASVSAALDHFAPLLRAGDYLVVEDGVVADLAGAHYAAYEDGPNRAVAEFLAKHATRYAIDAEQCDFYGPNVTYCPNAWIRCVG